MSRTRRALSGLSLLLAAVLGAATLTAATRLVAATVGHLATATRHERSL